MAFTEHGLMLPPNRAGHASGIVLMITSPEHLQIFEPDGCGYGYEEDVCIVTIHLVLSSESQ